MITKESMMAIEKSDLEEASRTLARGDIELLVEWLSAKDDDIRYRAFRLLLNRSALFDDVYPFWDILRDKLGSSNSYQRGIGLMLLAENARWDREKRTERIIDRFLGLLNDPKPVTLRQCIQSLGRIILCKPGLNRKIAEHLLNLDLSVYKESMGKLILLDILTVLISIRGTQKDHNLDIFIERALSSEMLDKKSKRKIETLLS